MITNAKHLIYFFVLFCLASWSQAQPIETIKDIVYRDGHPMWKLDMIRPLNQLEKQRPGIVFIHGGGFKYGDKANTHDKMKPFARKGYVCITLNYRLSDEVAFPAPLEDVKCAVRWFRANADTYNVDPDRIGGWGYSAGAHLIAMLGLTSPEDGFEGDGPYQEYSSKLDSVVPVAILSDLCIPPIRETRRAFLAGPPETFDERKVLASPITYVHKDAPPFLIIHGTADTSLDVSHAITFAEALEGKGAAYVDLLLMEDSTHKLYNESRAEFEPVIIDFFEKTLLDFAYENNFSSGKVFDDFTGQSNSFNVSGGKLRSTTTGQFKKIYLKNELVPKDADKFKIVSRMRKSAGIGWKGAAVRFRDIDNTHWYELQIKNGTGSNIGIYGKEGGAGISKGQWRRNINPTDFNTFSLIVSGNDVDLFLGNNFVGNATLSHTLGRIGLLQRRDDAIWDYFRVVSLGVSDYKEDFNDTLAQGWTLSNNFVVTESSICDYTLRQKSGTAWAFATYNEVVSVDANYRVSVEARAIGQRVKNFDSPVLVLKYVDDDNWICIFIQENVSTGNTKLRLRKKIRTNTSTMLEEYNLPSKPSLQNLSVSDWHTIEAKVDGDRISVWVNDKEQAFGEIEQDLTHSNFDNANTQCGVRSSTDNVQVEFDNFQFYDEYE